MRLGGFEALSTSACGAGILRFRCVSVMFSGFKGHLAVQGLREAWRFSHLSQVRFRLSWFQPRPRSLLAEIHSAGTPSLAGFHGKKGLGL